MKLRVYLSLVFVFSFLLNAFSVTLIIEGIYQNKNLYIQNGFSDDGVGFCTYEVMINGKVSTDEVTSKTFEIDFSALPIEPGTNVIVEIKHKSGCTPKVLNPEVLKPESSFEIVHMSVQKNGVLQWTSKNEVNELPFIIEQFRWNKWIKVGEMMGKGKTEVNNYQFQSVLHSGINKFRVKQLGFSGIERKSENASLVSDMKTPTHKIDGKKADIHFSTETLFEVYDAYGNIVKYGFGNNLSIANLDAGNYFLCYDNIVTDFTKK